MGSCSLLQGIPPTQGSNPGLPHCRWILCHLSPQGSPRILEWVSLSFLQGIFPTQESNQGFLHGRQILYQLSYQGSPKILHFQQAPVWCWHCWSFEQYWVVRLQACNPPPPWHFHVDVLQASQTKPHMTLLEFLSSFLKPTFLSIISFSQLLMPKILELSLVSIFPSLAYPIHQKMPLA